MTRFYLHGRSLPPVCPATGPEQSIRPQSWMWLGSGILHVSHSRPHGVVGRGWRSQRHPPGPLHWRTHVGGCGTTILKRRTDPEKRLSQYGETAVSVWGHSRSGWGHLGPRFRGWCV